MLKTILFIFGLFASSFASLGINFAVNVPLSPDIFHCLKTGDRFLIGQIWYAERGVNSNFSNNWQAAKDAGITTFDAFAWICNNCTGNNPLNISRSIKNALPDGFDGRVWIDIHWFPGNWVGDAAARMTFVQAVVAECRANGMKVGIYSSHSKWEQVFGSADYDAGLLKKFPLWYAHYDASPKMEDWDSVSFGGFTKPVMKQYIGQISVCSLNCDLNSS